MLVVVMATVGWVILAGLFSFSWAQAFDFPPEARRMDAGLVRAMAAAGLLAMYNYGGYSNICNIGEEIRAPDRTMPRAIVLSIAIVVVLYVVMSTVILGMVPWQEAKATRTIASLFIGRTFTDPAQGRAAAIVMTALILFVTRRRSMRWCSAIRASRSRRPETASSSPPSAACTPRSTFRTSRC
jgi:amino acid transporter